LPSPHAGQSPQSWGQLKHVSVPSHLPLPQLEQVPQSFAQVAQVSPLSHVPLPHVGGGALSGTGPSSYPPS
jgi:hypothetical protein